MPHSSTLRAVGRAHGRLLLGSIVLPWQMGLCQGTSLIKKLELLAKAVGAIFGSLAWSSMVEHRHAETRPFMAFVSQVMGMQLLCRSGIWFAAGRFSGAVPLKVVQGVHEMLAAFHAQYRHQGTGMGCSWCLCLHMKPST